MNIILCGFMGSGKSTIGRLLAEKLGRKFIDLDDYIVEKRGMSIRKSETQAAKNISKLENYVVSLGGGTVINPKNAEILKTGGKIILLNISPETVYERIKHDTSRPLLQTDDKIGAITNLLNSRLPFYNAAADFTITVDGKEKHEVMEEIIKITDKF